MEITLRSGVEMDHWLCSVGGRVGERFAVDLFLSLHLSLWMLLCFFEW